ncbi:hypothetical protein ABFS82_10G114500 [Erythranthe guttata]|nr:PREDICTED: uncharacterized protein LOC105956991 [Erythranthe guttata]XP_012836357.1 PREDICTED: uncharacterized protein LOC105956991 [Erythranthe guttata]|eukprot:XP_012836356.1 PREDICTED: uncharacterized protein LOC105956991 [Erythranthe guttata]
MGKHSGKNKKSLGDKSKESSNAKQTKASENGPKPYDKDTAVFISMSQELKIEGNGLFQTRDYEGAMLKYDKAIKLLPRSHVDVSYLRSNMAACYMQLGITEFPRAIHECNLALEVTPNYSKALLKRARCYEALNRLDLALRDVGTVLKTEPHNLMALEIQERVKRSIELRGSRENEIAKDLVVPSPQTKAPKEKARKKKNEKGVKEKTEIKEKIEEKKTEDKLVVEEEVVSNGASEEGITRRVKLVFGEDIRRADIPLHCDVLKLREIISDRFLSLDAVLVKYRDQEGDLVTITTTDELRLAEESAEHGSVKLYIVEVNPNQDPFFKKIRHDEMGDNLETKTIAENGRKKEVVQSESACISDWIVEFAQIFKNNVGFEVDSYLDLHKIGTKLYSDAMEETVTGEEAQDLFSNAADKFQEMAALALFNCGNVHMSMARKRVYFAEDSSRESQIKSSYDWAQTEFAKAGKRYEEALQIKPDFYEAVVALGQQQFEQAKLSWYYVIGTNVDLGSWDSTEVIQLYNKAEENMEKGMQMWESGEEQRVSEQKNKKIENILKKMKLDNFLKNVSADEEQAASIQSQINVLWGTILYERSVMEFKLGLDAWRECLEVALEKFELAGASETDIAVMIKNHCSNDTASEGLGFNIDELVEAWNDMYEAKKVRSSIASFRLEPLLRRRVSKLYYALEHA